jgi:sugar phosphate isomerase/epimerase
MRLGCNTVLFATQNLEQALARVAWCGFKEVELAAIPGMCEHILPTSDDAKRVRDQVEAAGLRAVAIEAAMNLTVPENVPRFLTVLRFAAQLGVEVVNTGNGGVSNDPESEQAAHAAIRQLAPQAQELGVKIGVKAHVKQAIYNTASALRALEAVDVAGWGINYDASHLYRVGDDMVQAVRQLGQRIVSVHIRDTLELVIPIGPPPTQVPGRGSIDLQAVLLALQELHYGGPIDLEIIGGKALQDWQSVALAAESRGYLHRVMQGLEGTWTR